MNRTLRSAGWAGWALALSLLASAAEAGRPCDERAPLVDAVERGMALAQATRQRLDASGARVVLLARAGQDLRQYGLNWSHFGFAYLADDGQGATVWRIVHELNHCGTADSALYRQGLGEFFLDNPYRYEAAFVVPSVEVQQRLLSILVDKSAVARLHNPHYSVVAYAWAEQYQQSNQWAIETLAMAMEPAATSRHRAQAWLQLRDYRPTTLHLGPLTRLGARISRANVAFDDHPNEKRFSDRIETVTVDSVFEWLQRSQIGGTPQLIR